MGRVYCDLLFTGLPHLPRLGQEVFAPDLSMSAGGGAFITAAAVKAVGGYGGLCAVLPATPFTDIVLRDMAEAGIDSSLCVTAAADQSPQITVATVLGDDRAFLTHASGPVLPDTNWDDTWHHLHIGELRTLVEHPRLVAQARDRNMTVSLDCGWDDTLMFRGTEMSDLVASVDLFLPNASEFETLTKSGLNKCAAPLTVIKQGARGAQAVTADTKDHCPALPVEVVDTTGAGDAFNGGFLATWLSGASISQALSMGVRCGAASVGQVGGTAGLRKMSQNPTQAAE
ncbi:carbohydrate kinase family protein [Tateyamaria omphalii]|uniref:carbohydrate kinase family protein n=1 Tax=Tateyamaria omphalii TaxID=299262 RepID=UPI0028F71825|nr:PfkB family carbohydrate kinase [Tateyamaria omphalii]